MPSTLVKIEKQGERFLFKGRGWGHGVGLCQFGAKRMAELGYRYQDILRYYYPDSEIRNLDNLSSKDLQKVTSVEEKDSRVKGWLRKVKSVIEDYY